MNLNALTPYVELESTMKRFMDDENFYMELIQAFIQEYNEASSQFALTLRQGDSETGRQSAHYFRGVAANLGLSGVAELLGQIEQASVRGDWPKANAALGNLNGLMNTIREAIGEN